MSNVLLKLPAVQAKTGLSRSSIYLWMSRGDFPTAVPVGARSIAWVEKEVDEWVSKRIKARQQS
ncbi:MAG TPA: AlpA family transcriptional regulator [Acidobacteriaceae bacterium]|nr:AlpA family transcriptional regulator [Acidobacteriaceae bacterium]